MEDDVLQAIENRRSVVLHGPAGVGKSFLIRSIVKYLTEQGKTVGCTAPTGIAAINLSIPEIFVAGMTIHAWSGVGIADQPPARLLARANHNDGARKRWLETDVLVIDEISMMGATMVDIVDFVGRKIRQVDRPFGGIQLVLVGDLLQLPPVKDKWIFQSQMWKDLIKPTITDGKKTRSIAVYILDQPKRYNDIPYFERLLRFRTGDHTQEDIDFLKTRFTAYEEWKRNELTKSKDDDLFCIKPTVLYSTKKDVEKENRDELNKLPGVEKFFVAKDIFEPRNGYARKEPYIKQFDDAIPDMITLKVGAQVMLKANLDIKGGLANGSRGVVVEMLSEGVRVKWLSGKTSIITVHTWTTDDKDAHASRTQIPLVLAWAMTFHKCVSGETMIFDTRGIRQISEYTDDDGWSTLDVPVHTIKGKERTAQVYKGEVEESIKITTRMGYVLEGSVRHPVLVRTESGNEVWRKLPNISIGDSVTLRLGEKCGRKTPLIVDYQTIKYKSKCIIPSTITEDLCYMIGALIGDGCYSRSTKDYTVEYCSNEDELLEEYQRIVLETFDVTCGIYYRKQRGSGTGNFGKAYFCSKEIREFLLYCGLDYVTCRQKKIPWVVMKNTLDCQRACLRGLFDTDGGVNNTCIHFTNTSEQLIDQIHLLLLNIGIISRKTQMSEGVWRIEITGLYAVDYMEQIGFVCLYKHERGQAQFGEQKTLIPKSNTGYVPGGAELIGRLREEIYEKEKCTTRCNSLKKRGAGGLISRIISGVTQLRYPHIPFIVSQIPGIKELGEAGREIHRMNRLGLFYDEVIFIEHGECMMYDLEVPGSHSFVSNGFVSHNCQGCTIDFAILNLGPSIFLDAQAYVGLSRLRNGNSLLISDLYPPGIRANPEALAFVKKLEKIANHVETPRESTKESKEEATEHFVGREDVHVTQTIDTQSVKPRKKKVEPEVRERIVYILNFIESDEE